MMNYYLGMKSIMLAAVLCAGGLFAADEAADRAAIEKTIAGLNVLSARSDSFTADFEDWTAMLRLWQSGPDGEPSVVISREPWGEATITWPGTGRIAAPIITRKIRFVTPEVALVDAEGNVPALFVMRKEGTYWKIASLRILEK
jgi:hypothetical protein